MDSKTNLQKSTLEQFENYKTLISAEIELIQRILEIRQNFSGSDDVDRLIEPIMRRIIQIRSEKSVIEKTLCLF
tara:strand:+ start:757 stop:978 length:222 start_codon:yes stop_codon:yes gene_type:complete